MVEVCAPPEQSTLLCCSKTEEADAASPKQSTPALFKIHLEEPRAQLHLNSDGDRHADRWYLDTGATNHMTGRRDVFSELDQSITGTVRFGDGSLVTIEGQGTVVFSTSSGEQQALTGVYFIPRLKSNLISVGQLDESDATVEIKRGVMRIWDQHERLLARIERGCNRLYTLHLDIDRPLSLAARADDNAWKWHERFGHINFNALQQLAKKQMVYGLPAIEHADQFCDTCVLTKQKRTPFPAQAKFRAEHALDLVHGDICGPVTPATPGGKKYFLLLVDDYSRFMWLLLLEAKSDAPAAIKRFQAAAELESGRKLKILRTDYGGEFTSLEFGDYCAAKGVQRHHSAPYSPQQNGVVERRNQTVMATARSLLKQRSMPAKFWGEAVSTAVFLLNRAPTKALNGKTPYEAWYGKKPAVSFLRTFGCLAFMKKTRPHQSKLEDRSTAVVFIGYEAGTKAYRVFDPVSQRVHITRDVVFDEKRGWDWSKVEESADGEWRTQEFTVESTTMLYNAPAPAAPTPIAAASPTPTDGGAEQTAHTPPPAPSAAPTAEQAPVEFATPPPDAEDQLDAEHSDTPVRFRRLDNVLGDDAPLPGMAERELAEGELHMVSSLEPASFAEAEKKLEWQQAMNEEIRAVEENKTWRLVELPPGHRPIGLRWVYKVKKDAAGNIVRHKARLVAKGYVQRAGIDFDEVFAPVARLESVRLLVATAAHAGWSLHHLDIKSAFLNGELREEVYVEQPPGFTIKGKEHLVYRLDKALYGLHQAPRAWNIKLDASLLELGFKQCATEHGIYTRGCRDQRLLIGVYVDDLIITGSNPKEIERFKAEMKAKFKMSDLGLLSFYLGIEVKQEKDKITLSQSAYAAKILTAGGMQGCNPCIVPMEPRFKLSKVSSAPAADATLYRSIVGSLRYLTHTRPDISFAVGYVSRFMEAPTAEHLAAVKRILRYLAGTLSYGLQYKKEEEKKNMKLVGYTDSDMAGDIDTRKSTSGCIFFLGSCPISWYSLKQRVVALSSCEAEYIVATSAACQGIWLSRLLGELQDEEPAPFELRMDNKAAIELCKNPVFHERSKHIDTRYHFIRDCVDQGKTRVSYINTKDQLADILTKALGRIQFEELRSKIGMIKIAKLEEAKT